MSNWISKNKRKDIYDKFKNQCAYCGIALNKLNETIDHLIPRRRGGKNNIENLIASCRSCNCSKSLKTLDEFRLYLSLNKASAPIAYTQCQVDQIYKLGLFVDFGVKDLHKFYFEAIQ